MYMEPLIPVLGALILRHFILQDVALSLLRNAFRSSLLRGELTSRTLEALDGVRGRPGVTRDQRRRHDAGTPKHRRCGVAPSRCTRRSGRDVSRHTGRGRSTHPDPSPPSPAEKYPFSRVSP